MLLIRRLRYVAPLISMMLHTISAASITAATRTSSAKRLLLLPRSYALRSAFIFDAILRRYAALMPLDAAALHAPLDTDDAASFISLMPQPRRHAIRATLITPRALMPRHFSCHAVDCAVC